MVNFGAFPGAQFRFSALVSKRTNEISLNQHIVCSLTSSIHWRHPKVRNKSRLGAISYKQIPYFGSFFKQIIGAFIYYIYELTLWL